MPCSLGILLTFFTIKVSMPVSVITYGALFGLGVGIAYAPPLAVAMQVGPPCRHGEMFVPLLQRLSVSLYCSGFLRRRALWMGLFSLASGEVLLYSIKYRLHSSTLIILARTMSIPLDPIPSKQQELLHLCQAIHLPDGIGFIFNKTVKYYSGLISFW